MLSVFFVCLLVICVSSLEKCLFISSHSLFKLRCLIFLILRGMTCFHILKINSLSVASFVSIFSHSEGDLFILFMFSLAMQKLLSFIRSHLFIFIFITIGSRLKKILL